jgi:hypothetical protein
MSADPSQVSVELQPLQRGEPAPEAEERRDPFMSAWPKQCTLSTCALQFI